MLFLSIISHIIYLLFIQLDLHRDMAMFSKISVKTTLVATYEEAEKIEAELESINKYPMELETKTFNSKKPLLLTRPKDE